MYRLDPLPSVKIFTEGKGGGGGSVHRLLEFGITAWNQESKTVFITIMFL